jgi:NTE family protein
MKIGLALSGGGFRATVFHLGVLARLAEENRLEDVTFISTVSGGSLCAGLVYARSEWGWPSSDHFKNAVLPQARDLLTTQDLQLGLIQRVLRNPLSILETRAGDMSTLLRERWGITARLRDLAPRPRWLINATCYETGKNWRFERFRMGDYRFGYTYDMNFLLSDAMAASAGFPGLVGALPLDARPYAWFTYADEARELKEPTDPEADRQRTRQPAPPPFPRVHLWDGGVYDNLGLEGLHNFMTGWRAGVDFLIASDASGRAKPETYQPGGKALHRIINVMMDQIRSLRSRAVLERIVNHQDPGGFLQIGSTCADTLSSAGKKDEAARLCLECLSPDEAKRAADMETVIRKLTQPEFERLFRHGFEVADYTLYAHYSDQFRAIGYGHTRWARPT